ncbi:receptor-like protein kinase 2 [Eucalyptus grandis]|uniref:receptor-like protein kinase 2 n=1 Tax=Eucalyptus grandis TaxID=71139 RepID=UPI00192EBF95|nr:receptor-like protein kinase 2 [Eucalyptus grandis]
MLDLSGHSTLVRLTFDNRGRLKEIDSSVGKSTHLRALNITDCELIEHVHDEIGVLAKPERFSLRGSYGVSIPPTSIDDSASLKKPDLSITRIGSLPESVGKLQCLSDLFLQFSGIAEIPGAIELLLPKAVGQLEKLEELYRGRRKELEGDIPDEEIDSSVGKSTQLRALNITDCELIEHVRDEIGVLAKPERFSLRGSYGVGIPPTSIGDSASLKKPDLSITRIGSLPESVGKLQLSDLLLQFSRIAEIPGAIEVLVKLRHLHLASDEIKQRPDFIGEINSPCTLNLSTNSLLSSNSSQWKLPKANGRLEKLEELYLGRRKELEGDIPDEEIHSSVGKSMQLRELNITDCELIELVRDEIGVLAKPERFSLHGSYSVSILPTSIGDSASLKKPDLSIARIGSLPESVGKLQYLSDLFLQFSGIAEIPGAIEVFVKQRHLHLASDEIKQLPEFIGEINSPCTLNLSTNRFLSTNSSQWKLPKAIGQLDKLEELYLGRRNELKGDIPDEEIDSPVGKSTHLRELNITDCELIEHVRDEIGVLAKPERFSLRGSYGVSILPTSIGDSASLKKPNLSIT